MATTAKKDYSALAAEMISRPSQRERPHRIFVYGRNKKGKTTMCTTPGQGEVLILDPEGGTDRLTVSDPDTWPITKWEDMDDVYKFARSGKHNYKWFAIDGLTKIGSMAIRYIVSQAEERDLDRRPGKIRIQDYGDAGKLMEAMLFNFHNLPYGLIMTAQERMVSGSEGGDADEDSEDASVYYVPDLQRGVRAAVNSMADVIGRIYTVHTEVQAKNRTTGEVVEKKVIQRRLWVEPHPSYDTGFRSEYGRIMPQYLKNPSVDRLVELMDNGKVAR